MASYNKTLQQLASKLGLSEEDKVLSKAAEFERLLQTKSIAGSNLSDTSKVVICLDLAAGIFGVEMDMKTAIKYSGLKPIQYTSNRKTVENLLELNSSKLTVPVLCVALQCASVQHLAETILEEYQRHSKVELNSSLPQYVCMAVYQACRINKLKVSKVKINEKCRLKPAQWAKLDADWTKFVDEKFAVAKKKRGRPAKNAVENGKNDENNQMDIDTSNKDEAVEAEEESYEDWKKRMLEAAYKELKQLEKKEKENRLRSPRKTPLKDVTSAKERGTPKIDLFKSPQKDILKSNTQKYLPKTNMDMSPRRSPRKTPQKFSPYTTPTKGNGVRLLFPNCL